jgi:hypothetical protein
MPNFPWSARGDVPPARDAAFEALLAGSLPPEDAPGGLRPLAEVIAALTAPPMRSEIVAEPGARQAYRSEFGRPARTTPRTHRRSRHRRPAFASLVPVRLAAASAVLLAILAAAAYSGMLPAAVQRFAHDSFGAPAPHPTAPVVHPATPAGPPAPAPDAHGLCTAYSRAQANGKINQKSGFFRKLADLAGGPAKVTAYCAAVTHPGKGPPSKTGKTGKTPPGQVGKTPPGNGGETPPGQAGKTPPGHGGKTPAGQGGKTPSGQAQLSGRTQPSPTAHKELRGRSATQNP